MAKDTGSTTETKAQEVDLDDLEVVILIVGKNASALNQAGSFLTRRGWPTTVMTNMSKAVEYIAEHKPDFVLVSFNHPNPAVMKLPDLIVQTFNLSCVGFIENMDSGSQQRLNNFKMRYKIQGMPSGPNLQRSIRKILAEKFNVKTDEEKRQDSSSSDRSRPGHESNTVTVKGGSKESATQKSSNMVKGSDAGGEGSAAGPTGRKRLSDIPEGAADEGNIGYMPDHSQGGGQSAGSVSVNSSKGSMGHGRVDQADEGDEGADGDSVSSGKYKMSGKKGRKSLKDLTASESEAPGDMLEGKGVENKSAKAGNLAEMLKKSLFGENGQDTSDADIEQAAADELNAAATQSGPDAVGGKNSTGGNASGGAVAAAQEAAAQAAQAAYAAQAATKNKSDAAKTKPEIENPTDAYYRNARRDPNAPATDGDSAALEKAAGSKSAPSQLEEMTAAQIAALSPAKLLERAVAAAMHRVCSPGSGSERELGLLTKVAVFPIDSAISPGYLVVGMEQDPNRIEDFFLKTCETALREEFAAIKVPAIIESGFWVHIPEVAFHTWAAEKGSFKIVLPHEEAEVGIGFFPMAGGALPKAEVYSENKEMLKISVDDISTEQPINFKAYLHLKKNKKYFLYLRNGRVLQPEQKGRLKDNQVQNIFMKSVEAENLRMFLAASFLRDTMKKAA